MTMRQDLLPTGVCPHEGREYELIACGRKRLALFGDQIPERFVNNPLELPLRRLNDPSLRCTVYYLPGAHDDAELLLCLIRIAARRDFDEHVHRQIGRLLDYEDCEIDRFIGYVTQLQEQALSPARGPRRCSGR